MIAVVSVGGYLVLGLLLDGPGSGYELGARASRAVSYFWPITRSHIYAELPKLVERGHATVEHVAQEAVPDKRVYTATEAGLHAFRGWLEGFTAVSERARQPLQIQLHFAQHTNAEHLLGQLDLWEAELRNTLVVCQELLADYAGHAGRTLTARFAINRAEADLAWITEARASLQ